MTRAAVFPLGAWPLEMRAEMAAGYVDEPSVEAFLAKVAKGIYSAPRREKGCQPKWHRLRLDHDVARNHGLMLEAPRPAEDISDLL